jgi:hypothetical protein
MRGEYKQAAEQCRSILRRFPNNATANVLLGDICTDEGDLSQAAQWYELALDLMPDSVTTRQKLESVRRRIEQTANQSVADQIGLPPPRSKSPWTLVVAIVGVTALGVAAYVLGSKVQQQSDRNIGAPIEAPREVGSAEQPKGGPEKTADQSSAAASAYGPGPAEDRTLAQMISQRSIEGSHLVSAQQDPRTGVVSLTYSVGAQEDERLIGAGLSKATIEQLASAHLVTLRAMRGGSLAYVADVRREAYEETLNPDFKQQHPNDPSAWVSHILSQEWSPTGAPATSAGTPNETGAVDTGSTGSPETSAGAPPGG